MRTAAWVGAALLCGGHLFTAPSVKAQTIAPLPAWTVTLPDGQHVRYEGLVNMDRAGLSQGAMLYPAPGLIGLLAAVATHGVIATSARNAEKSRLQSEADEVLRPYLGVLERLPDETLVRTALEAAHTPVPGRWSPAVADEAGAPAGSWRVEGLPVFRMTQDQSAFVLDHAVRILPTGTRTQDPVYEGTVRVVSVPLSGDQPQSRWLAEDGKLLRDTLAQLYARSIEIILGRAAHTLPEASGSARTVRYREGGSTRIERAKMVMTSGCDRWLIENLRGWLVSVPVTPAADTPCPPTAEQVAESNTQPR